MTPKDKNIVLHWAKNLSDEVGLGLVLTSDDRGIIFEAFCEEFHGLVPRIRIEKEEGDPGDIPQLRISENISYHALPQGKQLLPFLDALHNRNPAGDPASDINTRLRELELPASLRIYVAPACPFCPQVIRRILPLAACSDLVHIHVIDGVLFADWAKKDQVRSAPTTILDDQFRWTGVMAPEEILDVMFDRDPSRISAESLQRMLHGGEAQVLARMMVQNMQIFPAFLELLSHRKWTVRLGAMVAFEYLVEKRKDLAFQVVEPLWKRFEDVEDPVKGDILHIFGEVMDPAVISKLQEVLKGDYSKDVSEAAAEALEKIRRSPPGPL